MAKTKIYRKGGLNILDIENVPNRVHLSRVNFDLTATELKISQANSAYTIGEFKVALPDVQNKAGSPVGDYSAIEDYIAELRVDTYLSI